MAVGEYMKRSADEKTIVEVFWEDSTCSHGWQTRESVDKFKPWKIRSVGYLAHDDKDYIQIHESIAIHVGHDDSVPKDRGCTMVIPRSAVIGIVVLGKTRH